MARGRHRFRLVEDLGWRCAGQSLLSLVRLTGSLRGVKVYCWLACDVCDGYVHTTLFQEWCERQAIVSMVYKSNGSWIYIVLAVLVWLQSSETGSSPYLVLCSFNPTPTPLLPIPPDFSSPQKRNGENENDIQKGRPLLEGDDLPRRLPGTAPPPSPPSFPRFFRPRARRPPQPLGDGNAPLRCRPKLSRRPCCEGDLSPPRAAGAPSARPAATAARRCGAR